jgi:hypothetical protein
MKTEIKDEYYLVSPEFSRLSLETRKLIWEDRGDGTFLLTKVECCGEGCCDE